MIIQQPRTQILHSPEIHQISNQPIAKKGLLTGPIFRRQKWCSTVGEFGTRPIGRLRIAIEVISISIVFIIGTVKILAEC